MGRPSPALPTLGLRPLGDPPLYPRRLTHDALYSIERAGVTFLDTVATLAGERAVQATTGPEETAR